MTRWMIPATFLLQVKQCQTGLCWLDRIFCLIFPLCRQLQVCVEGLKIRQSVWIPESKQYTRLIFPLGRQLDVGVDGLKIRPSVCFLGSKQYTRTTTQVVVKKNSLKKTRSQLSERPRKKELVQGKTKTSNAYRQEKIKENASTVEKKEQERKPQIRSKHLE